MSRPPAESSDDLVREQAYLVARGVRPLAIIGECGTDTVTMMRAATRIETLSVPGAIPFVCDCKNGAAEFGFAAEPWVVDLFEWVMTADRSAVPTEHRHRVLGLLLGYSAAAVRDFEAHTSGRRFAEVRIVTSE
jgi:hypothetical protein